VAASRFGRSCARLRFDRHRLRRPRTEPAAPAGQIGAGPAQHLLAQRIDQAGLFGQRHELGRRHQAAHRWRQRTSASSPTGLSARQLDDRLVDHEELVALQAPGAGRPPAPSHGGCGGASRGGRPCSGRGRGRLASYIAVSASRSTDSTLADDTSLVTMPMLALDCTRRPASV
jgi:hypothetical protein